MLLCGDGLVSNLLLLYMRHAARESSSFSGSRAFPPGDPLLACGQFTLRPIESSKRPRLCINAGRFFSNLLLLYMRHAARESKTFSGSRASPYRIFEKTPPLHKCRQVLFESSACLIANAQKIPHSCSSAAVWRKAELFRKNPRPYGF